MDNTILLVDDVLMFIEIEKEFLQYSQVEVLTARNGLEALQVIETKRPDLVFMDLQMPLMNGAECCRAIKSDPRLIDITVIMVTAKGNQEDKDYCFSAGCDFFLTKPLDRDLFLEAARTFLPNIDRREKRLSTSIKGVLHINNETLSCSLHDLSHGGAYVAADYFAIPNNIIRISFTLPDGILIECHGRIAWVNRINSALPKGFGIKFALMSKEVKTTLAKFLDTAEVAPG